MLNLRTPQLPLANRVRVTLPYIYAEQLGNGSATAAYHRFRLAAPFDPDYEVGGDLPIGYATFAAMYGRAVVHRVWATVKFRPCDTSSVTTNASNFIAGVHFSGDQTPVDGSIAEFDTEAELYSTNAQRTQNEWFKWRKIARVISGYGASNGAGGSVRVKPIKFRWHGARGVSIRLPYGERSTSTGEDPYGVTFSTDGLPNFNAYFTMFGFSLPVDGQSSSGPDDRYPMPYFQANVFLRYDIEFFQKLTSS